MSHRGMGSQAKNDNSSEMSQNVRQFMIKRKLT